MEALKRKLATLDTVATDGGYNMVDTTFAAPVTTTTITTTILFSALQLQEQK